MGYGVADESPNLFEVSHPNDQIAAYLKCRHDADNRTGPVCVIYRR